MYLCFVNSTMKTVVVLIKEQVELQCSQVGCKTREAMEKLAQEGTEAAALSQTCSRLRNIPMLCMIKGICAV